MIEDQTRRIAELEDKLKARDRHIAELKHELDEQRDLVHRMNDHIRDREEQIESWVQR